MGVNANGAAAEVIRIYVCVYIYAHIYIYIEREREREIHNEFCQIEEKGTPWHVREDRRRLTGEPTKCLSVKQHGICSDPISADPICPSPNTFHLNGQINSNSNRTANSKLNINSHSNCNSNWC